jgi:hypothetical protein
MTIDRRFMISLSALKPISFRGYRPMALHSSLVHMVKNKQHIGLDMNPTPLTILMRRLSLFIYIGQVCLLAISGAFLCLWGFLDSRAYAKRS